MDQRNETMEMKTTETDAVQTAKLNQGNIA